MDTANENSERLSGQEGDLLVSVEASAMESLGGMHRCHLSYPIYLDYMSPELCAFSGYTMEDLIGENGRGTYIKIIHPDDAGKFVDFCRALAAEEGCKTVSYRVVKKNGDVVGVYDTMVSKRDENGVMWGFSVVVVGEGREDGSSLNDAAPDSDYCGEVDLSWDEASTARAKVVSCNDFFLNMLGFEENLITADKASVVSAVNIVFGDDIATLVPPCAIADLPYSSHAHGFLRKVDGSCVEVTYWARLACPGEGKFRCRLIVLPAPKSVSLDRAKNKAEFIKAMRSVYDLVFDTDLIKGTVRCVHNSFADDAVDPCEVPLDHEMTVIDWIERYFDDESTERFNEEIAPLFNTGPRLSSQLSLYRTYTVLIQEQAESIELFLFRSEDYMLVMIKLLADQNSQQGPEHHVYIRTFGYLEVFVDGKPLVFKHPKSRELFALLVDRRGGVVSSRAAATVLWDDKEPDDTVMARYRKFAMYLGETLDAAGVGYLLQNMRGNRSVNLALAECDLMDYLRLGNKAKHSFGGSYMSEYSWAEQTLGELVFRAGRS